MAKLSYKLGWRVTLSGTALDASGAKVRISFETAKGNDIKKRAANRIAGNRWLTSLFKEFLFGDIDFHNNNDGKEDEDK